MSFTSIPLTDVDANSGIIESVTTRDVLNSEDHEARIKDVEDFAIDSRNRNINDLINDTDVLDSAFETGISEATTSTIEGVLSQLREDAGFDGLAEIETNLIFEVDTVTNDTSFVVTDYNNYSAEFSNGDKLYIVRSDTINGVTTYAWTGEEITITGASHSAPDTTFTTTETYSLAVGDFIIKKGLITKEQSCVPLGDANSFEEMVEEGIVKINSVTNSGAASGLTHYWDLGTLTSGAEPYSVTGGPNLTIVGSNWSIAAGKTTAGSNANSSFSSGSRYLIDATTGFPGAGSVMAANWAQTWSCNGWFYQGAAFSGTQGIIGSWESTRGWRLYYDGSNVRITGGTSGFDTTQTANLFTNGQWHFVTINHRIDSGNSRWQVMVNGTQSNINDVNTSTAQPVVNPSGSTGLFQLGQSQGAGAPSAPDNSRYEEFFFFNRIVTLSEHQQYYNSGTGATPLGIETILRIAYESTLPASGQKIASKATTVKVGTPKINIIKHGIIKK